MGNTFCVTRKAASKKHTNGRISEFVGLVLVNEMSEKADLERDLLSANHEVGSGCSPDAEPVVASQPGSVRIKLVLTKQQLWELVLKRASVRDLIEVQKRCSNGGSMDTYWRPELESIPEENEIGCFL